MRIFLQQMSRTVLFAALAVAPVLALWGAGVNAADEFPNKPVHVVVPYAAGGADSYIRPLQAALAKNHGITLVIESVVGAGGTIGAAKVRRSAADGYTLLFCGSGALTIAPKLQGDSMSYADFSPLLNLVTIPYIVAVGKASPIRTAREFIDYIKRNPGKLSYGSPGVGSAPHLAMEALAVSTGAQMTHVPFSGIATAVQSMLGGHLDAVVGAPSNVMPQVRAGQLVALGVTSKERFSLVPQLPTLIESGAGAGVDVATHFGFLAPKGTPRAVIDKLIAALIDVARDPAFLAAMETMQTRVDVLPGEAYTAALAVESAYFDQIIKGMPKR